MKKLVLLFYSLLVVQAIGIAQLRLPNVLSDNMVLQRHAEANIWGWGYPTAKVVVKASWAADTVVAVVGAGGQWSARIPTAEAGGPHELYVASAGKELVLTNVLLGDVWFCSGQSNMEWGGNQNLPEILDELPNAHDDHIRLLQVSRVAGDYPQEDTPDTWKKLDAGTLKPFSAIGYFIAKNFRKELGVPIGIINASWGGTPAEVWTPAYLIEHDATLKQAASSQQAASYRPHEAGGLWNTMVYPITRFPISGAFWYQGESNVGTWSSYDKLMRTMVNAWRMAWDIEFPFYFVQIAPFAYGNDVPKAALLREQQAKTAKLLPNSAMVVITDLVDNINDIHPVQKREVANRLARLALHEHYLTPQDGDYKSPVYKSHEVKENSILIRFDDLQSGLQIKGDHITDLYIAGADQVFHEANGTVEGNVLRVSAPQVRHPLAVRFGFTETAMPNLFNESGLPVSPFRTDSWDW